MFLGDDAGPGRPRYSHPGEHSRAPSRGCCARPALAESRRGQVRALPEGPPPMRIAIGGIMHESNTFAPLPTDRRRFQEGSWTEGDALIEEWGQAHHEVAGFLAAGASLGFEAV